MKPIPLSRFQLKPEKKTKYRNQKTVVDGIKFDSKKEADYYGQLKLMKRAGVVLFWLRQVPFHLPGDIVYRADFLEFHTSGHIYVTDVKGFKTQEYKLKKKLLEETYPVVLNEV